MKSISGYQDFREALGIKTSHHKLGYLMPNLMAQGNQDSGAREVETMPLMWNYYFVLKSV